MEEFKELERKSTILFMRVNLKMGLKQDTEYLQTIKLEQHTKGIS
jgi:hypothetical protein